MCVCSSGVYVCSLCVCMCVCVCSSVVCVCVMSFSLTYGTSQLLSLWIMLLTAAISAQGKIRGQLFVYVFCVHKMCIYLSVLNILACIYTVDVCVCVGVGVCVFTCGCP